MFTASQIALFMKLVIRARRTFFDNAVFFENIFVLKLLYALNLQALWRKLMLH